MTSESGIRGSKPIITKEAPVGRGTGWCHAPKSLKLLGYSTGTMLEKFLSPKVNLIAPLGVCITSNKGTSTCNKEYKVFWTQRAKGTRRDRLPMGLVVEYGPIYVIFELMSCDTCWRLCLNELDGTRFFYRNTCEGRDLYTCFFVRVSFTTMPSWRCTQLKYLLKGLDIW